MHVPMKVDYGVRALVDLAGHQWEGRPVRTAEIADRQSIPEPYLDQLLTLLHKFGFIRSRRGPQGGHVLAKAPEEISVDMVMTTLKATGTHLECIEEPSECTLSNTCAQREVWRFVEETIHSLLRSTTIADLANRQRQLATQNMHQG